MNKYFASLSLTILLFVSAHISANPFIKLVPFIAENATQWTNKSVSLLNVELQLAFLNLFALNSPQSIKAFMQCIKFLEENKEIIPSFEALQETIGNILKKYLEPIEKKIAAKKERKELSTTEEESIRKQLDEKIQELVMYISAYYYQALYNHIAQTNPQSLTYIFDENGLIPQEKRTVMLPQSL